MSALNRLTVFMFTWVGIMIGISFCVGVAKFLGFEEWFISVLLSILSGMFAHRLVYPKEPK